MMSIDHAVDNIRGVLSAEREAGAAITGLADLAVRRIQGTALKGQLAALEAEL